MVHIEVVFTLSMCDGATGVWIQIRSRVCVDDAPRDIMATMDQPMSVYELGTRIGMMTSYRMIKRRAA